MFDKSYYGKCTEGAAPTRALLGNHSSNPVEYRTGTVPRFLTRRGGLIKAHPHCAPKISGNRLVAFCLLGSHLVYVTRFCCVCHMAKDFPCAQCGVPHPIGSHVGGLTADEKLARGTALAAARAAVKKSPPPVVKGTPLAGAPKVRPAAPVSQKVVVVRARDILGAREFLVGCGLSFVEEKHGAGPVHYSLEKPGVVFEIYPEGAGCPECAARREKHAARVGRWRGKKGGPGEGS